jgi:hypothetical protein
VGGILAQLCERRRPDRSSIALLSPSNSRHRTSVSSSLRASARPRRPGTRLRLRQAPIIPGVLRREGAPNAAFGALFSKNGRIRAAYPLHVVVKGIGLSLNQLLDRVRIQWHGVHLQQPDWSDHSHSLAAMIQSLSARFLLHRMFNAYWEPLTFEIPPVAAETGESWRPHGYRAGHSRRPLAMGCRARRGAGTYVAQPRSIVVLVLALPRCRSVLPEREYGHSSAPWPTCPTRSARGSRAKCDSVAALGSDTKSMERESVIA